MPTEKESVSVLNKYYEKEAERRELKHEAVSRFRSMLDESGVAYMRSTDDALLDEAEDKWCVGGSFKVYLSNNKESSNYVVPITFFIETQQKRFRGKAAEEGYFKVKLARVEQHVSKQQSKLGVMAMYFADDGKFYFKTVSNLLSYLQATRRDEKGMRSSFSANKDHVIRFDPKPEAEEKYSLMSIKNYDTNSDYFRTTFSKNMGIIPVTHENPLYFTEKEISKVLEENQKYEDIWKIKQKTISRIINRGE